MSDIKNNKEVPTNNAKVPNLKRRALAKAALASPVLGALASKPALGAGRVCSVSVIQSGNTSIGTDWDSCGSCSPGFWLRPPKECFLIDAESELDAITVSIHTTFGDIFDKATINTSPANIFDFVLNALVDWTLPLFGPKAKRSVFVPEVQRIASLSGYGTLLPDEENIADAIYMWARGLFCAWLNTRTIGKRFPYLILEGALFSISDLNKMVEDMYADASYYYTNVLVDHKDAIYATWDFKEQVACSMFGSCPKDEDNNYIIGDPDNPGNYNW